MASPQDQGGAAGQSGAEELVETPEGKGEIVATAQIPGDWLIRVELEGGGHWTGSIQELVGGGDLQAFERFKKTLSAQSPAKNPSP